MQAGWLGTFQHCKVEGDGMERRCECSESWAVREIYFGLVLLMFTKNSKKEIPLVNASGTC